MGHRTAGIKILEEECHDKPDEVIQVFTECKFLCNLYYSADEVISLEAGLNESITKVVGESKFLCNLYYSASS